MFSVSEVSLCLPLCLSPSLYPSSSLQLSSYVVLVASPSLSFPHSSCPLPSLSLSLRPRSTVFFWIDGRRRPCFFSRPETPTRPLVACENAIRWDGGNRISLLTRDCCRRRPPCFLRFLCFLLLRLLAPILASATLLLLVPCAASLFRTLSLPFLATNPYGGIHPSFLRPRINTTVRWKPGPARKPIGPLSFSILQSSLLSFSL